MDTSQLDMILGIVASLIVIMGLVMLFSGVKDMK